MCIQLRIVLLQPSKYLLDVAVERFRAEFMPTGHGVKKRGSYGDGK